MQRYETKHLKVQAEKFDLYRKPWPRSVETVIGDIGVPHPVIIGVQGNINLNHGDWIVYMPMGVITMGDELFHTLFVEEESFIADRTDDIASPRVYVSKGDRSYDKTFIKPVPEVQPSDGKPS
jgi:hypothetical protein